MEERKNLHIEAFAHGPIFVNVHFQKVDVAVLRGKFAELWIKRSTGSTPGCIEFHDHELVARR